VEREGKLATTATPPPGKSAAAYQAAFDEDAERLSVSASAARRAQPSNPPGPPARCSRKPTGEAVNHLADAVLLPPAE